MKDLQRRRDELAEADCAELPYPFCEGARLVFIRGFDAAVKEMEARYRPLVDAAKAVLHVWDTDEDHQPAFNALEEEIEKLT